MLINSSALNRERQDLCWARRRNTWRATGMRSWSQRGLPQCYQYLEDDTVEAIYDLLAAEPPGSDSAQDQDRCGGGGSGGTSPLADIVNIGCESLSLP